MTETPPAVRPGRLIAGTLVATVLVAIALAIGSAYAMHAAMSSVAPSDVLFYVVGAAAIVSAATVALSQNILYSALALLFTLTSVAILYIYLNADFLAVVQILVYVGGVLVLILFALMLTSRIGETGGTNPALHRAPALLLCGVLFALLCVLAFAVRWPVAKPFASTETAETIGNLLLGDYLLPFEVASLLLLATLVASVIVARPLRKGEAS